MKKKLMTMIVSIMSIHMMAQSFAGYSDRTTVYETYQPAKVKLVSGSVITQKEENIFLKNGRLLFKKGNHDMEADMKQILAVEFEDRSYIRFDTILAFVVDTVGSNRILCTTTIDIDAFNKQKMNDRIISNFRLGDSQITAASLEAPDEDNLYPLVHNFYMQIDGEIVKSHERVLRRMLPKDKRSRLDFYMRQPSFSWSDIGCLREVLELFNNN